MSRFLTIDTGGTNIKYALMDEDAVIFDQGEVPTPHDSLESYVETLGQIYDKYGDENIEAVCMSAPGRIDAMNGFFYTGGALQYINNTDLAGALKERIPVPFCAENDAKAAALAELWKGSMKGVSNGIVLVLGTGIGGAVILDGKLYRGTNFAAGEFSGIPSEWSSRYPTQSTWSDFNAVPGLMKKYAYTIGTNPASMNGRLFFGDVNAGKQEAVSELKWFCETMATGLMGLQLVLDVEKIALGGGISRQPILEKTLRESMEEAHARMPFFIPITLPEITTCEFSSDANMVGALYHYLYEYKPAMLNQQ